MYFEKLGFLLTFWNMAGVPFTYCHCALYLANHHPSEYHWNRYALAVFSILYVFFYWMWDSANGQKNAFRHKEKGQLIKRNTFPQTIQTDTGDHIMVDGWFAIIRKPNYVPDMFFSMSWGLITGFK
jgi:delta24(24(1))-sterol reductase